MRFEQIKGVGNMSKDPRAKQTDELIVRTFLEIMQKKPLNKITVKEICDKAQINRTTFYKHYLDVYDLNEKIEKSLFESYYGLFEVLETNGIEQGIIEMLSRIKQNADTYKLLFGAKKNSFFNEKLAEFIYNEITPLLCETPLFGKQVENVWFYNFLVWGCGGFVHNWVTNGMQEPVEDVAAFMEKMIANNIKPILSITIDN